MVSSFSESFKIVFPIFVCHEVVICPENCLTMIFKTVFLYNVRYLDFHNLYLITILEGEFKLVWPLSIDWQRFNCIIKVVR